jgi:hypothetical protein
MAIGPTRNSFSETPAGEELLNKPESWKTWLPLLGILVLFALVTAVWPALANAFSLPSFGGGSSTTIPYEAEPIHLESLQKILPFLPDTISPANAVLAVSGLIVALVVGTGGVLSLLSKLVYTLRDNTLETEAYATHQKALDLRGKEQIKQMRDGRSTDPIPSHKMPRWSVISNTLISLMFVGLATMVVVRNFFPEGTSMTEDGRIVSITTPIFILFAILTLLILGIRLRPQKLDALDATDFGKIPWDFIAVLISGLIMIGLGIGIMTYLNASG